MKDYLPKNWPLSAAVSYVAVLIVWCRAISNIPTYDMLGIPTAKLFIGPAIYTGIAVLIWIIVLIKAAVDHRRASRYPKDEPLFRNLHLDDK